MAKEKEEKKKPVHKHWLLKNIIAIAICISVLLFLLFTVLKFATRHNQELTVPSFTGMSVEAARTLAAKSELRVDVTDSVYIPKMERGDIYKQNPKAGEKVKKNRRILLTINTVTPRTVLMPSLVGFSLRQARAELASQQLRIGKLTYRPDMATDNVLQQKYKGRNIDPGAKIEPESEIELVLGLSQDDNQTYIPDLLGLQLLSAKDMIFDNSLNVGRVIFDESVKTYSDSISAYIYRQNPVPSSEESVNRGSKVTIYLTKDTEKIKKSENQSAQN